jgi:hypothetical protein
MLVDPKTGAMRTVAAVYEWRNVQTPPNAATAKPKERWLPPGPRWRKVNADGEFHTAEGVGGDCMVIRDHHGGFVSGSCWYVEGVSFLMKETQVQKVVLETNSVGVAAKLTRDEQDQTIYGPVVEEIKSLSIFGDFFYSIGATISE